MEIPFSLTGLTIAAILASSFAFFAFILTKNLKKKQYNERLRKSDLESIRNSFEKNIYSLNERLLKNEERWKDVNHLLLTNDTLDSSRLLSNRNTIHSNFLKANGITKRDLIINDKLIFIITPFNEKFRRDYDVIKEICVNMGYNAVRGDENEIKGDIFPEMLKLIVNANLIIANINGRNPNVLYELGIAQAIDKNVILISENPKELPIDIQSKRFLIYNDYNHLEDILRTEILAVSYKQS